MTAQSPLYNEDYTAEDLRDIVEDLRDTQHSAGAGLLKAHFEDWRDTIAQQLASADPDKPGAIGRLQGLYIAYDEAAGFFDSAIEYMNSKREGLEIAAGLAADPDPNAAEVEANYPPQESRPSRRASVRLAG